MGRFFGVWARVGEGMLERERGLVCGGGVVGGWVNLLFLCACRGCQPAAFWVAFRFFGTSFFRLGLFGFGLLAFFWSARLERVGCTVGQSQALLGVSDCRTFSYSSIGERVWKLTSHRSRFLPPP